MLLLGPFLTRCKAWRVKGPAAHTARRALHHLRHFLQAFSHAGYWGQGILVKLFSTPSATVADHCCSLAEPIYGSVRLLHTLTHRPNFHNDCG